MPMIRRHSFSSLYRLSPADVDSDASHDQRSVDDLDLANFSDTGHSEASTTRPAPRRSISRSNSLSNLSSKAAAVASLGLIAGAEAFTGGATAAAAGMSTGRMARRESMESASSDRHAGNTLTRTNSARSLNSAASTNSLGSVASASSLTSLNMVDPSTLMDVGSHMSGILDGSNGLDASSVLHTSTNLLSKISNTEMISSALVGAANRVFGGDQKKVEAEVFGDLSLASGLMQLAGPKHNKMATEATGIVSRCFGLISDYLPDGVVSPEEAVFQSCMMAISAASLTKSLQPVMANGTLNQPATFHEKKAYSVFKKHANMPWLQYKKMLAEAADWIDLDQYESVEDKVDDHDDGNFLYLVARGDAFDLDVDSSSLGLMGTLNLADKIKHGNSNTNTTDPASSDQNKDANAGCRPAQVCAPRAGASGAKLLRIDTTKLVDLMEADEIMAESVKSIVFADMQEKLMGFVSSQAAHGNDENPQLPGEVALVQ